MRAVATTTLTIISLFLFGQNFQRVYKNSINDFGILSNVAPLWNGGFLFIVNQQLPIIQGDNRAASRATIMDEYGNVLKTKIFYSQQSGATTAFGGLGQSLIVTDNKEIIFSREELTVNSQYNTSIICIDSNLQIRWSKLLSSQRNISNSTLQNIEGNTFIVSTYTTDTILPNGNFAQLKQKMAIYKLDRTGSVLMAKDIFSENSFGLSVSVEKNIRKQLVVSISNVSKAPLYQYPIQNDIKSCVLVMDTLLNITMSSCFDDLNVYTTTTLSNGSYIINATDCANSNCNRSLIGKLDSLLQPEWIVHLGEDEYTSFDRVTEVNNGDFYFSKYYSSMQESKIVLTRMNQAGFVHSEHVSNQRFSYPRLGRSKFGKYYRSSVDSAIAFVLTVTDSLEENLHCPLMPLCVVQPLPLSYVGASENFYVGNYNAIQNNNQDTFQNNIEAFDICSDVGILDAEFVLLRDTVCVSEQISFQSLPTLKIGNSEWYISGSKDTSFYEKDVSNYEFSLPGSYRILHVHQIGNCIDSVEKNLTVKGKLFTDQNITYCDTIFTNDIAVDCGFVWADSSSELYYVPSTNHLSILYSCDGCYGTTSINLVKVSKSSLEEKYIMLCKGDSVEVNLANTDIQTAFWGDGINELKRTFVMPGSYVVSLYNGLCYSYDTLSILQKDCGAPEDSVEAPQQDLSECVFYIPNTFSPNGDGQNDVFKVESNCNSVLSFNLKIYNKWGEKVFESQTMKDGWDGYYKGVLQMADVFAFVININDEKFSKNYSGSILLVR